MAKNSPAYCVLQWRNVFRRIFAYSAALAALSVSVDSGAQEAAACKYEARLTEPNTVWIDSNTGAILSSTTQFYAHRKRVDIYFVNKNPFGFTYTFDVKGFAPEGDVIREALKKITGFPSDEPEVKAQKESETRAALTAVGKIECPEGVDGKMSAVLAARDSLAQKLVSFNEDAETYNRRVGEISQKLPANEERCDALVKAVDEAITLINNSLENVKTSQDRLAEEIVGLGSKAAALERKLPRSPQKCGELVKLARKQIVESTAKLEKVEARMESILANKQGLENERARPDAFVTLYPIGPVTEPMEYTIKIERTSRSTSARTTAAASAPIRLGQARFSFSGGIAFGFADQKNYVRQASVVNDQLENIVGVDEESDTQVGVVGQLNGRLFGRGNVSVLWSLGASLTQGAGDSQFGFFTGPTLGMIDDRLFITAGYHLRKEKRLSGGFNRGDVIPEGLQGEIPTTEKTSGALLISVTYKLR